MEGASYVLASSEAPSSYIGGLRKAKSTTMNSIDHYSTRKQQVLVNTWRAGQRNKYNTKLLQKQPHPMLTQEQIVLR